MFNSDAVSGMWSEKHKLLASDGVTNDWFGGSVAVNNATIVVGAHFDDNERGTDAGNL